MKKLLTLCFLLAVIPEVAGQFNKHSVVIEYGPPPTYGAIGLHRLVLDPAGCQIQRFSGTIVALDRNRYLDMMVKQPTVNSFTLRVRGGRVVKLGLEDTNSRGLPGEQLVSFLRKGKRVNIRAYRCGGASLVDSIEVP